MSLDTLRKQMAAFYDPLRGDSIEQNAAFMAQRDAIWGAMDAYAQANPDCPPALLKARLHEEIAGQFEPVIFPGSPFFFEMGVRAAENWGTPDQHTVASWMLIRRRDIHGGPEAQRRLKCATDTLSLWNCNDVFDSDHHCIGYTGLFETGIDGLLAAIARHEPGADAEGRAFLDAARHSARALLLIADRFARKAEAEMSAAADPESRGFLEMIARTARRVPARPPQTFYEGLAALLFLREALASLEGIGISVLGHLDRLLGPLYESDLRAGRITEAGARDLLARWMLFTDVRFHVDDNPWPETSTCIELGGCDASGRPVFNEVTRLTIETHEACGLLNPKLNCRYGSASPRAYLDLVGKTLSRGHNHFAFLNDDVLIPACVKAGKAQAEARLYVNGGCQETIVEGVEHSAGAYYYFNMVRVLDLCLQPFPLPADSDPALAALKPEPISDAPDFESFYARFMAEMAKTLRTGANWLAEGGRAWSRVNPCPMFSATINDCIQKGRDYTAGGARHNPAGMALVGMGTIVDSLHAIRALVFEERALTLSGLRAALAANWEGHEGLRARAIALPKYGHDNPEVNALAGRFAADIAAMARGLVNERGGPFQPSFFVYYAFVSMSGNVRATPDGRRNGELLSQGIAPGRIRPPEAITDILNSIGTVDFTDFAGNSVLDMQLPLGVNLSSEVFGGLLRTFSGLGGPTIQMNCVSLEDMKDAQLHPQRHGDLVVRIAGLSAKFIALSRSVQDEIIQRHIYAA